MTKAPNISGADGLYRIADKNTDDAKPDDGCNSEQLRDQNKDGNRSERSFARENTNHKRRHEQRQFVSKNPEGRTREHSRTSG